MPQEFDYCERCGAKKSIYTDTYKGLNICKPCMKVVDELPAWVSKRDKEYKRLLRIAILGAKGAALVNA